ncbi:MAG: YbaK/EbsC family protein, partial [Terriglobales bacterium]
VASCAKCKYAANLEKASSRLASVEDLPAKGDGKPQPVETPGMKTIEDVARFLKVSPTQKIKTLAYMAGDTATPKAVVVFVRGDHTLNEAKLTAAVGGQFRPMQPEEIEQIFGSPAGYLGPIGTEKMSYQGAPVTVLVDEALRGRKNLVSGANRENYHLWNVTPERDFAVRQWVDLRSVEAGEGCPQCGEPLQVAKAVEIGHIFKLGYKYSEAMGARVLAQDGKEVTPIMGSYGIGLERILTSTIEQNHDADGFWLPPQIAPFEVLVTPTNAADPKLLEAAHQVAKQLEAAGHDVLLDDRDERPGVKFKDADLVGVPFRITVGKKVSEGKVEVVRRSTRETRDATIAEIGQEFEQIFRAG